MKYDAKLDLYYDGRNHRYIDGGTGAVIPSVTQIVRAMLPNKYAGVDPFILARAAEYGNKIHDIAESFALGDDKKAWEMVKTPLEFKAADNAYRLLKKLSGDVTAEQTVRNGNHYAGRYDLLIGDVLIDIKTTSRLDYDALYWQLGLYAECIQPRPKTAVLWLPKHGACKFEYVESATAEEVEMMVLRYELDNTE